MEQASTQVVELSANLDDVTAEIVGEAVERLLDEGAVDVWCTPILMKKQRPGVMVSLLCLERDQEHLTRRLIELTGTFGVRRRLWDRLVLARRHESVDTPFGPIRLKIGVMDHKPILAKPEFEDVREAAEEHGVPLRVVMDAARVAAEAWITLTTGAPGGVFDPGKSGGHS
jgi:hypothetical protein